jgi:hypothetical protein
MFTIPLNSGKNQSLQTVINNRAIGITLYMQGEYLFMNFSINGVPIKFAQLCLNQVLMFTDDYIGLNGGLIFEDTEGSADPQIDGLGARFQLRFFEKGIDYAI